MLRFSRSLILLRQSQNVLLHRRDHRCQNGGLVNSRLGSGQSMLHSARSVEDIHGSRTCSHGCCPAGGAKFFDLAVALPAPAGAGDIYKCQSGDKTSVQSQPCDAGAQTVWTRSVKPEPDSRVKARAEQQAEARAKAEFDLEMLRTHRGSGSPAFYTSDGRRITPRLDLESTSRATRCRAAQQRAAKLRVDLGSPLSVEDLRNLNAWLSEKCP